MRIPKLVLTFAFILIITAGSCRKAPEPLHTGDYGQMQEADLLGSHVCESVGAKNRKKFQWTFTDERFEVTAQDGSLPSEVCQAILGGGAMAKRIEGEWRVAGSDLILTELSGNGKTGLQEARLHPFITGPAMLRINLGNTQYILTRPKPPNDPVSPPTRPK